MQFKNLEIKGNYPLRELTTMKIGGAARFFAVVDSVDDLRLGMEFAREQKLKILILSGGSNIVVSDKGFDGLVLYINIKGWDVLDENNKGVIIKVGAGEVWDKVVERAVNNKWWGIENLSNIPGKAGAFVVQNAGAYGQQCSDVLDRVEVYERETGEIQELSKQECGFGYRQSIFNHSEKGKYVILNVFLKLAKVRDFKIYYPDVKKYFAERNIIKPSLKQIREAIIFIRDSKLPNAKKIGSAGSFFRNLLLNEQEYSILLESIKRSFGGAEAEKVKELKGRFFQDGEIKIPTAFLIDICGLKGEQFGGAKVYEAQPLVLVNEAGKATADDVMNLFKKVRQTVYKKTGMKILPEPELIGFEGEELDRYFELI